jgi:hypothetical protein
LNDIPPSSKPRSATNSASASPSSRGPSHSHSRSGYSTVPAHVHVPAYNKSNSNSHVRRGRSSSPRSRDAGIDTTPRYTSDYSENDNYHDAERDRDKHMDELFSGKYSSFSPSFSRYNADIQHQHQQQLHQSSSVGQSAVGGDAPVRFRCDDPSMPTEEMMYAGLYRLNEQQHEAYRHFVNMLVEYDTTGQLRIIEDAFKDAQVESLLCNFSGT